MLAVFRRNLNSWVARLFFIMLIGTFVLWGVGDVVRNFASDSGVATVAGRKIEVPEVQDAYRRQLAQVTRMFGGRIEPTPQMRKGIAAQALEGIITQAALGDAVARLGLVVPDDAVRQATFDTPSFRGASGQFSRDQFVAVLRNNGFTEARYLDLMRADLGQRQLMDAVRAGMASPEVLTRAVYAFQRETRIADAVDLAFSAPPRIEPPTDALLTRWYENNKARYSTPELRHIHAVILAPATVASEIQISEDEIKAVYEQRRAGYNLPEKRSVQVLLTQDEAKAKELAAKWLLGGEFAALATDGAVPVELTDAIKAEIPAPELADAVFAAAADVVPAPVHSALGWHVFKVTKIEPGTQKTLADVSAELRARILADKAADLIYERASKIEDLLAGGTKLQELPADFGLAAVAGTMDAQGNTAAGEPAPIPGPPALRAALAQAVFAAAKGEPAKLNEVPRDAEGNQAYFAVDVDDITPATPRPIADVMTKVTEDWTRDAIRHALEAQAAAILTDIKTGKPLAAAASGLVIRRLPAAGRSSGAEGFPAQLVEPLFGLKPGEPTMVETTEGFTVAVLVQIVDPDVNADPIGFGQTRDALGKALGDDVQGVLITALRGRAKPQINPAVLNSITQTE